MALPGPPVSFLAASPSTSFTAALRGLVNLDAALLGFERFVNRFVQLLLFHGASLGTVINGSKSHASAVPRVYAETQSTAPRMSTQPRAKSGKPRSAKPATTGPRPSFPVVGVGASAGGLEAFSQLLQGLPSDTGLAFVLVQHLAAKHESILPSILSRSTAMPVRQAEEGMPLEPNHVYVIPPGQDMLIHDGNLALRPRASSDRPHMPVDLFLRSLAEVRGGQAVAVVLSGTGSDGTMGCKAVKSAGGISFAQEPGSARYDGMPRSAIAAGCVDLVLTPEGRREITPSGDDYLQPAGELESSPDAKELDPSTRSWPCYTRDPAPISRHTKAHAPAPRAAPMALLRMEHFTEYPLAREEPARGGEPSPGSSHQRDHVLPGSRHVRVPGVPGVPGCCGNGPDAPLRVWVPGCACGERLLMAIALIEAATAVAASPSLQIFGTDVSAR
jgi:two-component system CheB/CheR fusion protein